jgi:hypothetical protein
VRATSPSIGILQERARGRVSMFEIARAEAWAALSAFSAPPPLPILQS